jgi:glutathione S-transferase
MAVDFYHGHGSPYSWRVWLALEHLEVPYKLNVLSFASQDTRKPEFIALNPRHLVPTIVDEGFVLWESMVVLEYLDERFGNGRTLYPGDIRERARVRRLAREAEQYLDLKGIDIITTEYFGKDGAAPDAEKVADAKKVVAEELEFFAQELQGDWLSRHGMSAADMVLYPWVGYVKRITVRKPETKLAELLPEKIVAWAKRIEALPYFDKTFPPHWR